MCCNAELLALLLGEKSERAADNEEELRGSPPEDMDETDAGYELGFAAGCRHGYSAARDLIRKYLVVEEEA